MNNTNAVLFGLIALIPFAQADTYTVRGTHKGGKAAAGTVQLNEDGTVLVTLGDVTYRGRNQGGQVTLEPGTQAQPATATVGVRGSLLGEQAKASATPTSPAGKAAGSLKLKGDKVRLQLNFADGTPPLRLHGSRDRQSELADAQLARQNTLKQLSAAETKAFNTPNPTPAERKAFDDARKAHKNAVELETELFDNARQQALKDQDLDAARELSAGTLKQLSAAETKAFNTPDPTPAERKAFDDARKAHKNAVELETELFDNARQQALKDQDLDAARELSAGTLKQLSAAETKAFNTPDPTPAERKAFDDARKAHKNAVELETELFDNARQQALKDQDLDAARELSAGTLKQLSAAEAKAFNTPDPTPAERKAFDDARKAHKNAVELETELFDDARQQALKDQDLDAARELSAGTLKQLSAAETKAFNTPDPTPAERKAFDGARKAHKNAVELETELFDNARQQALKTQDLDAARELSAGTLKQLSAAEAKAFNTPDPAPAERKAFDDARKAHKNAVELETELFDNARQQALKDQDLDAARELTKSSTQQLAAAEEKAFSTPDPTPAERKAHKDARKAHKRAMELEAELNERALKEVEHAKDLSGAQFLVSDSTLTLLDLEASHAGKQDLSPAQLEELEALRRQQQRASALRNTLFEKKLLAVGTSDDPQAALARLIQGNRENAQALDKALVKRDFTKPRDLPPLTLTERRTLESQQIRLQKVKRSLGS